MDQGTLRVFRPRRRCERCALVNADNAARCRRCGAAFSTADRAAASERVARSAALGRTAAYVVAIGIVVGLAVAGWAYYSRTVALVRFGERARAVEADVRALVRGARADAGALLDAFDDAEALAALREQEPAWRDREARCAEVGAAVSELVPQSPEQATRERDIEAQIELVRGVSADLAVAAAAGDLGAARAAAARLRPEGESPPDDE